MKKSELDKATAIELDEEYLNVSLVTEVFLKKLMSAIASGEEVHLKGFGKFRMVLNNGAPLPRFGNKPAVPAAQRPRYRVHFSKSLTFRREIHKEKSRGEVRRR